MNRVFIAALTSITLLITAGAQAQGLGGIIDQGQEIVDQGQQFLNGGGGNEDEFVGPPAPSDDILAGDSSLTGDGPALVRKGFAQLDSFDSSLAGSRGSGEMFFDQSLRRSQNGGSDSRYNIQGTQRKLGSIAPINMFKTTMGAVGDQNMLDLATNAMTSPLGVLGTTTSLVDPTLGQSFMSTMAMGFSKSQGDAIAEINLQGQLAANPDIAELGMASITGCISGLLETTGISRSQASEECSTKFSMRHDPNFPTDLAAAAPGTLPQDANLAASGAFFSLRGYLFSRAWEALRPGGIAPDADRAAALEQLNKSFLEILGDYNFGMIERRPGESDQDLLNRFNAMQDKGFRDFTVTRMNPGVGPDATKLELKKARFNDQMRLLYQLCSYNQPQAGVPAQSDAPDFWEASAGAKDILRRLSVRGFVYPRELVEEIYSNYRNASSQLTSNCGDFGTVAGSPSNFEALVSSSNGRSAEYQRVAFAIAERIAEAQFIGTLMAAEDLVKSLSGGGRDNLVRQYAFNLIYGAAGTKDLDNPYIENIRQLKSEAGNFIARSRNQNSRGIDLGGAMQRGSSNSAPLGMRGSI